MLKHSTSGVGAFEPGDESWTTIYHIELNPDGTFSEVNFWTPEFTATGTWELSGSALTLALDVEDAGWLPFAAERALAFSPDGDVLTMEYRRPQWDYTAVFLRSPARDGIAAIIVANNTLDPEDSIDVVVFDSAENAVAVWHALEPGRFAAFSLDPGDYFVVAICSIGGAYSYPPRAEEGEAATACVRGTLRLNFSGWELLRK